MTPVAVVLRVMALSVVCAAASGATKTTAYGGLELGNTDANRVDAGVNFRFLDDWNAGVSIARAHVAFPDVTTNSTLAVAKGSYDFGAFSLGGGYRHGEIENVSTSRGWFVNAGFARRELHFGLEVEARRTTLEPEAFTEDLGGTLGIASGTTHCSVEGRGYQGRIDWDRPTWSLFVAAHVYDYDDYDCVLDITSLVAPPPPAPPGGGRGNGNGNAPGRNKPPHARGRTLGNRLAAASVDDVADAPSRLVPREAALLDSSLSLGVTLPVTGNWIGGAELYRDVERIDGSDTLTGLVFAGRRLSGAWTLEISVGYSAAQDIDDTAFAGVRFTGAL